MRYFHAVAVAVFAAALVMAAAGCGEQKTTPAANTSDSAQAAQVQKDLDQAKMDLKKVQDELAAKQGELNAKIMENQDLKKQLDAANAKLADITKSVQDAMKLAAPTTPATPSGQ